MGASWADIFPYLAGALKLIVLGIGGYYAVKWHFDEEAKVREEEDGVFNRAKYMKKMVLILVFIMVLMVFTVYATNWLLY